jgi:hydroxyacylglutathione hydrolase
MTLAEFKKGVDDLNAIVIDLRRQEAFGGGHIPGSFNIGGDQNLSMWAAWVVPYDRPIYLVGEEGVESHARRQLVRVGLDNVKGYLKGGFKTWLLAGYPVAHVPQISTMELQQRLANNKIVVVDVRNPNEWRNGHIAGAKHMPAGEIQRRATELPKEKPIHVICGSGYRSSLATSILRREAFPDVTNVMGGMTSWTKAGLPVEK